MSTYNYGYKDRVLYYYPRAYSMFNYTTRLWEIWIPALKGIEGDVPKFLGTSETPQGAWREAWEKVGWCKTC